MFLDNLEQHLSSGLVFFFFYVKLQNDGVVGHRLRDLVYLYPAANMTGW